MDLLISTMSSFLIKKTLLFSIQSSWIEAYAQENGFFIYD